MNYLNASEWLQLIAICITLLTAIVSIIIAVSTLKQNERMIEESTRPYIVVYSAITYSTDPTYKLIIKSSGQSGGTITKFRCDHNLSDFAIGDDKRVIFENLEGLFMAPGQSIVCAFDHNKLINKNVDILKFEIEYRAENKTYAQSIELRVEAHRDQLSPKAPVSDGDLKAISYTLQDIVDNML